MILQHLLPAIDQVYEELGIIYICWGFETKILTVRGHNGHPEEF